MPNVITHGLLAQDVIGQLEPTLLTQAIQDYPSAYLFGSNGPDYLFYYLVLKPFPGHELNSEITKLGGRVHTEKINDFYQQGIQWLAGLEGEDYTIFKSYLAGHLTHWALDTVAHPYVFHKTGVIAGDERYHHFRMESMIDTLMVTLVKKGQLKDYPSYKFVKLSKKEKLVIAKGYQFIINAIFSKKYKLKTFITAMDNMYKVLHLFMDSTSIKQKSLHFIEKNVFKDPWIYTKHFVYGEPDHEHDILNLQHNEWNHPSHQEWVYTTSFVDLYEEAIERGVEALNRLESDINTKGLSLVSFIDNRKYDTGTNDEEPMRYFNVIY